MMRHTFEGSIRVPHVGALAKYVDGDAGAAAHHEAEAPPHGLNAVWPAASDVTVVQTWTLGRRRRRRGSRFAGNPSRPLVDRRRHAHTQPSPLRVVRRANVSASGLLPGAGVTTWTAPGSVDT